MPAGMAPLAGKPFEANIDFEVRFMADSKVCRFLAVFNSSIGDLVTDSLALTH
jgi:hypothetical protein